MDLPRYQKAILKRLHVSNISFRKREHNLIVLFGQFGDVGFGFIMMTRTRM